MSKSGALSIELLGRKHRTLATELNSTKVQGGVNHQS